MKIDKIDKKILYLLDRDCRITDTKIGKLISKSKESVRSRIKKYIDNKVITGYTVFIDKTKLGYTPYKLYLKISNVPEKKELLIKEIKENPNIFWFSVIDGAWDIGLTYFSKTSQDYFDFQNQILSEYRDIIIKKETGIVVNIYFGSKKFLIDNKKDYFTTQGFNKLEHYVLDDLELKIIDILLNNSRTSFSEMSRRLNVSIDVIKSRINKLIKREIITRFYAKIDFSKLGCEFYKAFLYLKCVSKDDLQKIINYHSNDPNIINMVRQISSWDLEFEIMVENYQKYNQIVNDIKLNFANIISNLESVILSDDVLFPAKKVV